MVDLQEQLRLLQALRQAINTPQAKEALTTAIKTLQAADRLAEACDTHLAPSELPMWLKRRLYSVVAAVRGREEG